MKACVATGEKRTVECRDIPIPKAEPGWILLKTKYACICGSDLEYLDGSFGMIRHGVTHPEIYMQQRLGNAKDDEEAYRLDMSLIRPGSIPGHEFVAEVVEIGEGVTGWSVGDRAIPVGNPNPLNPQPGYETYRCMAEYFVSTPYGVIKVPDHLTDEQAVLVEPLCTGNGSVATAGVRPGQSAVVFGAGKIGLLAAMAAKVAGASPVISIDLVNSRLDKAREMGVDVGLNAGEVDIITEVMKITGEGPNAVLICVRDGKVLNQAAEMVKRGGSIVLAGFVAPMEVNPMLWSVKMLKITGILGGSMLDSLYMVAHGQIDPRPLITEIIPFDDCQRAIDSVYNGQNIAVLLKP